MPIYKTPDVYVEEISTLPPSVAEVSTAIPAFIGYTEKAEKEDEDLMFKPTRITTLLEYKNLFGHLKHIRDSAIHIEDRGRGVNRNQKPINTHIIVIGCFIERRFTFTGEDGKQYEIEISDATLNVAKEIIQKIINSYVWK